MSSLAKGNVKNLPLCVKPKPKPLTLKELQELYIKIWDYPPPKPKPKPRYPHCVYQEEELVYAPCWEKPHMPMHILLGPCWDFRVKKKIIEPKITKIKKQIKRQFIRITPDLDNCEVLYTQIDFKLEQCVHGQILKVEAQFQALLDKLMQEKEKQKLWLEEIHYQTSRYRILVRSGCCVKLYPEYISRPAEERALCQFQKLVEKVTVSNMEMADDVINIKESLAELKRRVDQLDLSLKSPFILGQGTFAPPLSTVLEMIADLYKYFYGVISKMKRWSELIEPGNEYSQNDYIAILNDTNDFPIFMKIGTEQCTCKRNANKHPLECYTPCWCRRYELFMESPKPWVKYRCDVSVMARLSSSTSQLAKNEEDDTPQPSELSIDPHATKDVRKKGGGGIAEPLAAILDVDDSEIFYKDNNKLCV